MRALHPHGRRHAVYHGAEAAGGHPVVRLLELEVLRRPHLVLADLRRAEGAAILGVLVDTLAGVLRIANLSFLTQLHDCALETPRVLLSPALYTLLIKFQLPSLPC